MTTTHAISVRDLRENLSLYLRAVEMKNMHFVVMRHSEPVAKIIPQKKKRKTQKELKEELLRDIQEAEKQIKRGEWITQEEMEAKIARRLASDTRKLPKKTSIN